MNCVSTMTLSKTTTDEHDLPCGNIPLSQWGQNSPHTQLWGLAVQSLHSSLFTSYCPNPFLRRIAVRTFLV